MRNWLLNCLGVLLLAPCLGIGQARGAAAPYTDWAFDMSRANKARDLTKLEALVEKEPDFARVWFYGQVFDLATVGIPEAELAELKVRLIRLGETLAKASPPDPLPLLLLDRLPSGELKKDAERARAFQAQWLGAQRAMNTLSVQMAVPEEPAMAVAVFYGLFFRAELASRRLGGRREKARLLALARTMAIGFALGLGDLRPWRCLAKYAGQTAVPISKTGVVEQQIEQGLNAYLAGDLGAAKTWLENALGTSREARKGSLLLALILNGTAHAERWLNRPDQARNIRGNVLQVLRPLKREVLTALLLRQLVQDDLAAGVTPSVIRYTQELRGMDARLVSDTTLLEVLARAAQGLLDGAKAAQDAGELASAVTTLQESGAIWGVLSRDEIIAVGHLSGERAAVKDRRLRKQLTVLWALARIAERRGRYDEARVSYQKVVLFAAGQVNDQVEAAAGENAQARIALSVGDATSGMNLAKAALVRLGAGGDVLVRAESYGAVATGRLINAELPRALANANYGLQILKDAGRSGDALPLRAQLHFIAARVLEAAGYLHEAEGRLAFALSLDPGHFQIGQALAVMKLEAGDMDGSVAVLQAFLKGRRAREAGIDQACVLIQGGHFEDGLSMLEVLVPQLVGSPNIRANLIGRTCLAAAYITLDRLRDADRVLVGAREAIQRYPDPHLAWRVHLLDGQVNALSGYWFEAAGALRQALSRFMVALEELAWRGMTVDQRSMALPAQPGDILDVLPGALARSAARDKANTTAHYMAALEAAQWVQKWRHVPIAPGQVAIDSNNAVSRTTRGLLERLGSLRHVLADDEVELAHRIAAQEAFKKAAEQLRDAVVTLRVTDPVRIDYFAPQPTGLSLEEDEVLLRYFVLDGESHLWVVTPGQEVRHYDLPGRSVLAELLSSAFTEIRTEPQVWAPQKRRAKDPNAKSWKTLSKPVAVLLPFLKDKKLLAAIEGKTLTIVPDGPLVRFPLQALVLKAPGRKAVGQPPVFFGSMYSLRYAFLQQAGPMPLSEGPHLGIFGPLSQANGGCPIALEGDPCAPEGGAELAKEIMSFVGQPEPIHLAGDQTRTNDLMTALDGVVNLTVVAPMDMASGSFVTSPSTGTEPYARVGQHLLVPGRAGHQTLTISHPIWGAMVSERGDGLRRLVSILRSRGLRAVLLSADGRLGGNDYFATRMAWGLSKGYPLELVYDAVIEDARKTIIDPKLGGPARHHPFYWGQHLLYTDGSAPPKGPEGQLVLPQARDAGAAQGPSEAEKAKAAGEMADPFAK